MTNFILDYVDTNKDSWNCKPTVFAGDGFQHCVVLIFGTPKTAVFAHIDSIGFTVRYNNELVRIGAPQAETGYRLVGEDSGGAIDAMLQVDKNERFLKANFSRAIDRGTELTFKPEWVEDDDHVQCCYMDNRLGVLNALNLCKVIENGAVVFSCWEEHGGGSVPFLIRFLYDNYKISQALISDITWVTEGVHPGKGAVISLRDTGIPRRSFINKILALADASGIPYQMEVEGSGGSDGTELQKQPYPIDWCFIGAPEDNVHTPYERVHKEDITSMFRLYVHLLRHL